MHSLKGNANLFLGVSYEVDVGKEDGKVDHRVEGHQPKYENMTRSHITQVCQRTYKTPTNEC